MVSEEEEYYRPAQTHQVLSRAIHSSLSRLNSLMRSFGGKKIFWSKSSRVDNEDDDGSTGKLDGKYVPLDMAIRETCSKGSLLERIASLEDRLLQMCLEIESYRRSCSSSINTSCGASSSSNINGPKTERMSSYPTFAYKPQGNQQPRAPYNLSEFEAETPGSTQRINIKASSSMKQQPKHQGNKKDRKSGRKWKKGMSPNWPHLKILGC